MSSVTSFKTYLQWWRMWGTFPVLSWIKAADKYRNGRYLEAEHLYRAGIVSYAKHPARVSAQLDLSYCLFKQRKVAEAEKELQYVVAHFPDHREGYVRLARIQLWLGRSAEASLTLRRGLQRFEEDAEIIALLLFAFVDQRASRHLIGDVASKAKKALEVTPGHKLLKVAQARCLFHIGEREQGKMLAQAMALEEPALFEAVVAFAEILIEEKRYDEALRHLRRALQVSPSHPRVLSLVAKLYLIDAENFNPEYSQQLAISACQASAWASPRDMHVLAEAYLRGGDRLSALMTASRARDIGSQASREYAHVGTLDKLIQTLMTEGQSPT